jgi:hypothetical protein
MLMFSSNYTYAFHENLGIDDNKASELYHTNPNDPAIVQWKSALQSAINGMDKCFDLESAISCHSLMSTIISNCNSHPNELLACNDARLPQYPSILKNAMDKCFDIVTVISREPSMSTLINNCKSHLNGLLACNDARLPQYPSILKNGQIKAEAETEAEYKKAQAEFNQTRLKFEKCMEEGGTINTCKLKNYTTGNKSQ